MWTPGLGWCSCPASPRRSRRRARRSPGAGRNAGASWRSRIRSTGPRSASPGIRVSPSSRCSVHAVEVAEKVIYSWSIGPRGREAAHSRPGIVANSAASALNCSAMKAAILHGPRDLRIEVARAPEPGAGEALVRVAVAGLCGTDYSIFSGGRPVTYPRVMGHEFVGRVEAVGAGVTTPHVGDRVAIEPNYSCGVCPLCREGNRNLCLSRTAVGIDGDGCFAELVRVPARCCWSAPPGVADDDLVGTEPLAVAVRAGGRGQVRAGGATAGVGVGTRGLRALQGL